MTDSHFRTIREALDISRHTFRTNFMKNFEQMSTLIIKAHQLQVSTEDLEASWKEKADILKSIEERIAIAREWIDSLQPLAEKL